MSIKYKLEDFNTDMTADWSSIEDGGDARKIEISIFNPLIPQYYRNRTDILLNNFIRDHKIKNPTNDIDSISGIVHAFIDKDVKLNEKYSVLFYIYVKENKEIKGYIIEEPILPVNTHFAEFKHCVMKELENLIF